MIKYEDKIQKMKLEKKNDDMISKIQETAEDFGLEIGDIDMSDVQK